MKALLLFSFVPVFGRISASQNRAPRTKPRLGFRLALGTEAKAAGGIEASMARCFPFFSVHNFRSCWGWEAWREDAFARSSVATWDQEDAHRRLRSLLFRRKKIPEFRLKNTVW